MTDRPTLYVRYLRSPYAPRGNGGVKALAEAAGLHHNAVYRALHHDGQKSDPETVVKLAQALDAAERGEGA